MINVRESHIRYFRNLFLAVLTVSSGVLVPVVGKAQCLDCLPKDPVDCSVPYIAEFFASFEPTTALATASYKHIFASACVRHDYCYRFGYRTYGYSRKRCDKVFKDNMGRICSRTTWADFATLGLSKGACFGAAGTFFAAVRAGGGGSYKSDDSLFCEYDGPAESCSSSTPDNELCWTKRFSEEGDSGAVCPQGRAVAGMWCFGDYCDDKYLACRTFEDTERTKDTGWISDETPGNAYLLDISQEETVITGLTCNGDYCDEIAGQIGYSPRHTEVVSSEWQPAISEEDGRRLCPDNQFVTGILCHGDFCDNIAMQCSQFKPVPKPVKPVKAVIGAGN